jgi:cAMP-dependent protein kinase regulator
MSGQQKEYITEILNPFLKEIVSATVLKKPEDPVLFMIEWLQNKLGLPKKQYEKEELRILRQEVARLKEIQNKGSEVEASHSDEDEDEEEILEIINLPKKQERHRSGVSAEAYGKWNQKGNFVPRVIEKTQDQIDRLLVKLNGSFMFASLDSKDKGIVVSAMEERKVPPGKAVITQGEDGNELFVVGSGTLKCYKNINGEEKYLKDYHPGEAFGELALLYNARRAASIIAHTDCELWVLDRECFNNIVKDSAIRRRERYDEFLSKISLFQEMDPYERSQLADGLKNIAFNRDEYVIKEGEEGNQFYIIEEGTAIALKSLHPGKPPEKVKEYGPSDYFGELALIKNMPRAASIQATSPLSCVSLDRHTFKRVLGPIESILKRNAQKYDEIMVKLS